MSSKKKPSLLHDEYKELVSTASLLRILARDRRSNSTVCSDAGNGAKGTPMNLGIFSFRFSHERNCVVSKIQDNVYQVGVRKEWVRRQLCSDTLTLELRNPIQYPTTRCNLKPIYPLQTGMHEPWLLISCELPILHCMTNTNTYSRSMRLQMYARTRRGRQTYLTNNTRADRKFVALLASIPKLISRSVTPSQSLGFVTNTSSSCRS